MRKIVIFFEENASNLIFLPKVVGNFMAVFLCPSFWQQLQTFFLRFPLLGDLKKVAGGMWSITFCKVSQHNSKLNRNHNFWTCFFGQIVIRSQMDDERKLVIKHVKIRIENCVPKNSHTLRIDAVLWNNITLQNST